MTNLAQEATLTLREAGFDVQSADIDGHVAYTFENDTLLGFFMAYDSAEDLIAHWSEDTDRLAKFRQFQLRAAGTKAWNCYTVLLARSQPDPAQSAALNAIEEDLVGVRKLAKAGCEHATDVVAALLPILPLQTGAVLDVINSREEIRQRTTELPTIVVETFLSAADPQAVFQLLEAEP